MNGGYWWRQVPTAIAAPYAAPVAGDPVTNTYPYSIPTPYPILRIPTIIITIAIIIGGASNIICA